MARAIVFWDYSNFDIALKTLELRYPSNVRCDLRGLVAELVGTNDLVKVYFVCSLAPGEESTAARKFYDTVDRYPYFYVKSFSRIPKMDGGSVEKQVDTYLACQIVALAYENAYDEAIIISGDQDMLPAIEIVQQKGKVVTVVAMGSALSDEVKRRADRFILLGGPLKDRLLKFTARE